VIYLKLFWTFFKIGLLGFGSGFANLALMEHEAVNVNHWVSADQFRQIIYVANFTPGPVAVSGSSLVGFKAAGTWGAIVSTLGLVIPSGVIPVIVFFLVLRYGDQPIVKGLLKGLGPVIVALIVIVAFNISKGVFKTFDIWMILLGLGALAALYFKVNPFLVLLGGALFGLAFFR